MRAEWKSITPDSSTPTNQPSQRQGHTTIAFSSRRAFLIIFGGKSSNNPKRESNSQDGKTIFFNDSYRFDCKAKTWTPLVCSGDIPPPRAYHSGVAIDNTRMLITGGSNGRTRLNDIYQLNVGTLVWEHVSSNQTEVSLSSYQIYSAAVLPNHPQKIIIFGVLSNSAARAAESVSGARTGTDPTASLARCIVNLSTGQLDPSVLTTASRSRSLEVVPPARSHYSSVTYNNEIILFGGFDGTVRYNDVHLFNLVTHAWTRVGTSGNVPEGRYKHDACVCGDFMFVVGGYSVQWLNEIQMLNLKTWSWQKLHTKNTNTNPTTTNLTTTHNNNSLSRGPSRDSLLANAKGVVPRPRESHTITSIGSFIYMFGGWSWPNAMNDMCRFNAGRIVRKLKSEAHPHPQKNSSTKKKASHSVVRKIPSTGSIMMTELDSSGSTHNLMITGNSNNSNSNSNTNSSGMDTPMFSLTNKAFRSSHDRRNGSGTASPLRRSNSNLLMARKTSSPLPSIQQLTQDSDDEKEDGLNVLVAQRHEMQVDDMHSNHSSNIKRRQNFSLKPSSSTTPAPTKSSYSPKTTAANRRRREYQQMLSSDLTDNTSNKETRTRSRQDPSKRYPLSSLDQEQRQGMRHEVDRRVQAAVQLHQKHIKEQEERKRKAELGLKALRELFGEIDNETIKLKSEILIEEQESSQWTKNNNSTSSSMFEHSYNVHKAEKNSQVQNSHLAVKQSLSKINEMKKQIIEQHASKQRIKEHSLHLKDQISKLKQSIERDENEGHKVHASGNDGGIDGDGDALNESIQSMTMKVQGQSETRRQLTVELNALKENQSLLKQQIKDQIDSFETMAVEEEELRGKVQHMVHHLAGPSVATEERPYESMSKSMFGDQSHIMNGMMISR